MLQDLQRIDRKNESGESPDLPNVGEKLANWVHVLLKTNDEEKPESMAHFIHQALVRRDVVVRLIEGAKARGHRAYRAVDMQRVRSKAEALPENGIPPEVLAVIPHDNSLDKILI